MKNVLHTFGKKTLAIVVAGFLATGLGLTTAQAAHANTGTTQTSKEPAQANSGAAQTSTGKPGAGTFQCPNEMMLEEIRKVYRRNPNSMEFVKVKDIYKCSNSDGSAKAEYSVDY